MLRAIYKKSSILFFILVLGSEYNKLIFSKKYPSNIKHHLFFSFKGDFSLLLPENNDGTVTLLSQLDYHAQTHAWRVYGFDEGHVSILKSDEVITQYNQILKTADK